MATDKKTIGATSENHDFLEKLTAVDGYFAEMTDAYRFAISIAIRYGQIADPGMATTTLINAGTLDPDGIIRNLIMALYPETETPYRQAELLAGKGLEILQNHYNLTESLSFKDIFKSADGVLDPLSQAID